MTDLVDRNHACFVVNEVGGTIAALSHAIRVGIARQLFGPTRPRIAGRPLDLGDYALTIRLRANGLQFLPGGRLALETI